jgi:DHA1 family tetracycline resistance protein-like MFS transporter
MTSRVDPHEQGRLQGAVSSLASLEGVFAPTIFTQVFALFISDHAPVQLPGAPFLLSAGLLIAGLIVAARVTLALPRHLHAQALPEAVGREPG